MHTIFRDRLASTPIFKQKTQVAILALLMLVAGQSLAHSEPPPPPSTTIYSSSKGQLILPRRWSWLHWWEANRWRLLEPRAQTETLQGDNTNVEKAKTRAEKLLVTSAEHENAELRGSAILALGRLESEKALPLLSQGLNDQKQYIRQKSLIALGMISDGNSESTLAGFTPSSMFDANDRMASMGLLRSLSNQSLNNLANGLAQDWLKQGEAELAVWVLSQNAGEYTGPLIVNVLDQTKTEEIASECLIALGKSQHPMAHRVLASVLLTEDKNLNDNRLLLDFPVWRRLAAQYRAEAKGNGKTTRTRVRNPDGTPQKNDQGGDVYREHTTGNVYGPSQLSLAKLRVSAAIGLTLMNTPQANQTLLDAQFMPDTDYSKTYKAFAAIGLGENGYAPAVPVLIQTLPGQPIAPGRTRLGQDHPICGFAALALGLYAKQVPTEQGPTDRPHTIEALNALGQVLINPKQTLETRSACAVGMALSGRTANLQPLSKIDINSRHQPLLTGYTCFARGALGDTSMIQQTPQVLANLPESDTERILAARAVVLGIGMLGSRESLPVLTQAWHNGHYTSREVIQALRLMNLPSAALSICDLYETSDKIIEQTYFCLLLGDLLGTRQPSPMNRFMANSNFTYRIDTRKPYQSMANGFLFDYLIPTLTTKSQ